MDYILGIDLGTTNSLVGVVDSGFPILLADQNGDRSTPSAVHYAADGRITVGRSALNQRAVDGSRVVTSVKRLIGRREGEGNWQPTYDLAKLGVSAVEVSAETLKHLKVVAEQALGVAVSKAVITVPAYFNDGQRQATKRAGELAGLTVERILSEPTAAALAYGLDKLEEHRKIAVYDLGGGTFDVSVLEMRNGVFQVLATAGDTQLGGDDIDLALAQWIFTAANLNIQDFDDLSHEQKTRLIIAAEKAKKELSTADIAQITEPFFHNQVSLDIEITREVLNRVALPVIERTRRHCLRALSDAGVKVEELDEVLLVGGVTRMALVRSQVAAWFGREPNTTQNPDEAIAMGAVIQAGIIGGTLKNVVLLDVTPLSLGIETFGGLMNIIIPRNTTIPCKAGEMFTNAVSGQEVMLIKVLQGERELSKDNWELGRIEVPFPAGAKGSARVGVQFSLDANGILQVLARDTATDIDQILEIQNSAVDVDDQRVEQMIAESVEYAFEDMNERIWTEARAKSEELLAAVKEALVLCTGLIGDDEVEKIKDQAKQVELVMNTEPHDARALKAANKLLDDGTQNLAVMLVEKAMEEALERKLA